MVRTQGHWSNVDGNTYAYFYRSVDGYGPGELLVGVAIPSVESRAFRWAALVATAISTGLLVLAVIAAFRVAQRISAPVVQLEDALMKLERMEFDDLKLPELQRSRITEWAVSAKRLSKAADALTQFNQYVPGKLARRLMAQPQDAACAQERHVTVMFMDMEGFSKFASEHTAAATAAHLNSVFEVIGPIIERAGGVIDKYTGDGLMAFWGAPDIQLNHQRRALIAALEIQRVLSNADPVRKLARGPRLRIGLHSGSAIVGNLGFEGRFNYTLIGTTVNIAERVEQRLRGLRQTQTVIIGLSENMFDSAMEFDGMELTSIQSLNNGLQVAIISSDIESEYLTLATAIGEH